MALVRAAIGILFKKTLNSASTARAIRSRAPVRSSSWSGSLTSGVGEETASRVESVMAYPFLLVVIVSVINQQDTPLFQIAPYTRNEHSSLDEMLRWANALIPLHRSKKDTRAA